MERQKYTLTRLRSLMDQDQARIAEARSLYSQWQEKLSKASLTRSFIMLGGILLLNVIWITAPTGEEGRNRLIMALLLLLVAYGATHLYPLGAKWEWENFLKGEEAYIKNTWKTSYPPEVSLWWDEELELYEVRIGHSGESYSIGHVKEDDSFIEDFEALM